MSGEAPTGAWQDVLAKYDLGEVGAVQAGGGTAAPKVIVATASGRYLLRRRRPEMSYDEVVAFDHRAIAAAGDAGLPVARPLTGRDGRTWVRRGDCTYELFPFIEGLERFRPGDRGQIAAAAAALARLHRATAPLEPPARKRWPREHLISTMTETLAAALQTHSDDDLFRAEAAQMLASARRLGSELSPELVASLPHTVTHGDYTPANVQFRGDTIGGIFDFDWVSRQARLQDVGEALQFFAFPRLRELDPDSIWSLVGAWRPDPNAAALFLHAYQDEWPLDAAEGAALPLFMRETWLGCRIRAMRKVAPQDQLRILTEGALEPLQWLEANAEMMAFLAQATAL
ncbi:MAG: phosphotransferase [Anaerolineae bacterium]